MSDGTRLYRFLLLLYPPAFRRRFGGEMLALFQQRLATQSGVQAWWHVIRDAMRTIPASWFQALGRRRYHRQSALLPSIGYRRQEVFWSLLRDLRFAFRNLRRAPGFTALAVITLGLGVGANAAIFSVVNGVMLRPLPYPQPDRLFTMWRTDPERLVRGAMSQPNLRDIQSEIPMLQAGGFSTTSVTLTGSGDPEVLSAARVTDGLLAVLGAPPVLGRDIRQEENVPGGPRVVVVGHAFWQERLGGRADVLGTTLELAGRPYEIVGVAPPGFEYPRGSQFWIPRYLNTEGCGRGCHVLRVIARLDADASEEQVRAQIDAFAARIRDAYPASSFGTHFNLEPLAQTVYGHVRTGLFVLLGAVGLVLLIACANVANLLLVRATTRTGEVAVRAALGASRSRLVTQLLLESLVLAVLGGVVGLVLAQVGLGVMLGLASNLPRVDRIAIDGTVLLFSLGTITVTTLLFGLAPAIGLSRVSTVEGLNYGGRGESGSPKQGLARSALLVAEVSMSLMLLFGAGLLMRTFSQLRAVELGFAHERVLTFSLSLPGIRYPTEDDAVRFFETLEERIATVPGVEAVGGALGSAMDRSNVNGSFTLLDRPEQPTGQEPVELIRYVTPGYFDALRVPILRGRNVESRDRRDMPRVALISESFAKRYFPDKDPLGVEIDLDVSVGYPEREPRTIVGVVGDLRSRTVRRDPQPEVYVPVAQAGPDFLTMAVRSAAGTNDVLPAIRSVIREMEPNLALRRVETLTTTVERSFGPTRFYLSLLVAFAGLAAVLAGVGLYGVIGYLVSQRTREIGVRIALGARRNDIVRMVVGQGLRPALLGIGLGLAGTLAGARILGSLLYNVTPLDVTALITATGILLGVVVLAILVPAGRASRIPPVVALRSER